MVGQLEPVNLVAPGFRGLNLSRAGSILDPSFATQASNCVIDDEGRLAARSGFSDVTTTDITSNPTIKSLFEYRREAGTVSTILAWNGGISDDIADPEGNDISGVVTDAEGRWWFQNYNDKCIGFQDGQKPIVFTGTGNFATVVESSGTAPTSKGGVGLCAYGRVWGVDSDGQTIKYSALLDETDWGGAGSGSIDMSNVWTDGTDVIKAIVAFNGRFIVFGLRHIIVWTDGTGSQLGLDPANITVTDVITGTGCVTQWSIQPVGESDLLYLSRNGVQSLARVILTNSNPVETVSKNVRDDMITRLKMLSDTDGIRSVYSPRNGFYLITFPVSGTANGITYVIDQRYPYQDEEGDRLNIITTWDLAPTSWLSSDDFELRLGGTHGVGLYAGLDTDNGSTFRFIYESPWLELGEVFADRLKILKRIGGILFIQTSASVIFKWSTDFNASFNSLTKDISSDAASEWGIAEWSIGEWSGGLSLRIIKLPARDTGQYFRIGLEGDVSGPFAIQQLELFTKIGRLA
jgi:hypothetical protein